MNECGKVFREYTGVPEPAKQPSSIALVCRLQEGHEGRHYKRPQVFDQRIAGRNVDRRVKEFHAALVRVSILFLFCGSVGAQDLRPVPSTAQTKIAFSKKHPRLWAIRQHCRFMLPVAQFLGSVAQCVTPFVVR